MRSWVVGLVLVACQGAPEPNAPVGSPAASASVRLLPTPAARAKARPVAEVDPVETTTAEEQPPVPVLFRRYPGLSSLGWVSLLGGPTPVERARALEQHLGVRRLYVKRDDVCAPLYGGGKPRKLEFLLGEALAQGHSRVVTWGGVGSNQAVATAAYGQKLGLETTLLLLPQKATPQVRANLLADVHFGAALELVQSQQRAVERARALDAYVVPIGGSSPQGNLGFVNAGFELDEQIAAGELPEPHRIYIPMGTMGSAIGLAIGLRAAGRGTRVVAVRASNLNTSSSQHFEELFQRTVAYLTEHDPAFPAVTLADAGVMLEPSQLGKGYAIPTDAGRRAVELAAEFAALQLETTYTGKALAALVSDREALSEATVLFWNTHNSLPLPGDHADREQIPRAFGGYLR